MKLKASSFAWVEADLREWLFITFLVISSSNVLDFWYESVKRCFLTKISYSKLIDLQISWSVRIKPWTALMRPKVSLFIVANNRNQIGVLFIDNDLMLWKSMPTFYLIILSIYVEIFYIFTYHFWRLAL